MTQQITEEMVLAEIVAILDELKGDWEYSGDITLETQLFGDLGLESIDLVALSAAIEERYRQSLPFAEFIEQMLERPAPVDVSIHELVVFTQQHLAAQPAGVSQ
jgi:acyl carrier protein